MYFKNAVAPMLSLFISQHDFKRENKMIKTKDHVYSTAIMSREMGVSGISS